MRVEVVPVLADNYAYLLIDEASGAAACVDPAEAGLVLAAARKENLDLSMVLTTHWHPDHAGGNEEMARQIPGIEVVGGELDEVKACTKSVKHNETLQLGEITVMALHTPGHTKGSMSFYCTDPSGSKALFTGDTLFVGGCGRIFECTTQDLFNSLTNVIGQLPAETQVWVGHEYTLKNLEFAEAVDTDNKSLSNMVAWAKEQRLAAKFTVPSTLQNEWLCNPFMRSMDPQMQSVCPGCTPLDVFTRLRREKDIFKGPQEADAVRSKLKSEAPGSKM